MFFIRPNSNNRLFPCGRTQIQIQTLNQQLERNVISDDILTTTVPFTLLSIVNYKTVKHVFFTAQNNLY